MLIDEALSPPQGQASGRGDIEPLSLKRDEKGKVKLPLQQQVADHLHRWFGAQILKQDRDLFLYTGTYWQHCPQNKHDFLRTLIQRACQGLASASFVEACYKLFIWGCPTPPEGVDMFTPHPAIANFLNGSLHLTRLPDRSYRLDFLPHRREDYLINVLPLQYDVTRSQRNDEFHAMLGRVFKDNPDAQDKIRAVRQMYGACLMPAFPHLFMLFGQPGTGKSTVMNVAARLVHRDNLSKVPPSAFTGFNMETMAGKLVNIDTDIPSDLPIRDEIVKKIIDRAPFRISRKGIKDIYAPIPAIHMFGANQLPKALDGVSRAHDRRWTFIGFDAFVPKGNYDREYWDYCFEQNPQGVLNFALQGLEDLIESRGHFLVPESGRQKMEEWQLRTDVVGEFLRDVQDGEVALALEVGKQIDQIFTGPGAEIPRPYLWSAFVSWHKEAHRIEPRIGRTTFFSTLRTKGFAEKAVKGVRYFVGIGHRVRGAA